MNSTHTMNRDAILKCIEYVMQSELDDFRENPSDNHIYYHAMVALQGKKSADEELSQAMEDHFAEQELSE